MRKLELVKTSQIGGSMSSKIEKSRSNRIYPKIKCKHCKKDFVPRDSRQLYCSSQHRVDAGNDRRKHESATRFLNQKILRKNDCILESVSTRMKQLKIITITFRELQLLGIDRLDILVERTQFENDDVVQWYYEYGLQAANKEVTEFKVIQKQREKNAV